MQLAANTATTTHTLKSSTLSLTVFNLVLAFCSTKCFHMMDITGSSLLSTSQVLVSLLLMLFVITADARYLIPLVNKILSSKSTVNNLDMFQMEFSG